MIEDFKGDISYGDKIDFRRTLQILIERCLYTKGTNRFGFEVDRLILAIETEFPGMDFATPIQNKRLELQQLYRDKLDYLKLYHPEIWYHPLRQGIEDETYKEEYFLELFEFVRDLLARHRGLLFGTRQTVGGIPMEE